MIKEEIRKFDLESFIRKLDLDYRLSNTGELYVCCPFCGDDRYRLYFNLKTKVHFCHNCQHKGDLYKFAASFFDCTYNEAVKKLSEYDLPVFFPSEEKEKEETVIRLPSDFRVFKRLNHKNMVYWMYLAEKRKLSPSVIHDYKIGYCPTGYYAGRVVVPVYADGKLVSWVARSITPKAEKKVLVAPGAAQSNYLFNLDKVYMNDYVVITEGVFDALMIPDMAVASFGKKLSRKQINSLYLMGVRNLVFCWDGDAMSEILTTFSDISVLFDVSLVDLPKDKDPNDLGEVELRSLIYKSRKPLDGEIISNVIKS